MDQENPTPSNEGASITDRIQAYLSPESQPESQAEDTPSQETGDAVVVEPDGDGEQQANEPQLSTTDLAKYLGIDEAALDLDEDGTVKLKTKVDGVEGAAKLQDLLKSYQLQEHVDRKAREAADREKALAARQQQAEQQIQARLQHVEQLTNLAGNELAREYQSINWEALRQTDPGQYAALRADFQERGTKLQQTLAQVEQQRQFQAGQFNQQIEQRKAAEAQRLVQLVPEWKNAETFSKESAEIWEMAAKRGVPDQFLQAVSNGPLVNAGVISLMRDALAFQKLQQSKATTENKVRTAPKLVKPGTPPAQDAQQKTLGNLKHVIQKSGGKRGIADYLIASGIVK